jgi:hypothetical protein
VDLCLFKSLHRYIQIYRIYTHIYIHAQALEQIELGSGSSEMEEVTVVEMVDPVRFYVHTGRRVSSRRLVTDTCLLQLHVTEDEMTP